VIEAEWLACGDPCKMLWFVEEGNYNRPLRLFAVACCRQVWALLTDERSQRAVEVAERYADGVATEEELETAFEAAAEASFPRCLTGADEITRQAARLAYYAAAPVPLRSGTIHSLGWEAAYHVARFAAEGSAAPVSTDLAHLLRDVLGLLPFRPPPSLPASVLRWNDGTVRRIAEGIYEERVFDRLPILADALLDAGCDDEELMLHLRSPGPHVKGCWALDLVLGKQ